MTEQRVRLRPLRTTQPRTVVGFFDTLAEAGDAVARVTLGFVLGGRDRVPDGIRRFGLVAAQRQAEHAGGERPGADGGRFRAAR